MTEAWELGWNELNGRVRAFAAERDPDFVAAFVQGEEGVVEIRRSAPTGDDLAREYATLVHAGGFRSPVFCQVPVSVRDEEALTRLLVDAESALQAAGVRVWSIRSADRAGTTRIVSYEDADDRGVPRFLLDELARFPPGTVELRRVTGPTHRGL